MFSTIYKGWGAKGSLIRVSITDGGELLDIWLTLIDISNAPHYNELVHEATLRVTLRIISLFYGVTQSIFFSEADFQISRMYKKGNLSKF